MRFTVTVPDEIDEQIRAYCEKEGLSKSEWVNRAIGEKLERRAPGYAPPGAAEGAARELLLKERADEISWLRGQVALLSERLAPPPALPEKAGPGRRWWRFWE